ncbi:EamA family transporter [Sedimentitalea sp. XS_ASV28]|uniref:EamA family transporter n=1 Tax=Sedimentitalea sp. XS_ASV28 TaxID=3241296 RepID=UPI0035121022
MNTLILGLVAAFCWGLHDIAIRYLSKTVPLLGALLVVLLTALAFQSGVILINGTTMLPTGPALWLSIGAGIAFLFASLGLYFAFERGPVRLVSPIIGAYPILSLVYAMLGGSQVSADQIAAVLVIVCAVGLVAILSDPAADDVPARGPTIALSLLSAIGFASTFKLGQMAAEYGGEWQSTFATRAIALAGLCALLLVLRPDLRIGRKALVPLITMGVLDGIALLAVISAGVLERPEFAAVAASMFGLFTILLARVFLKEQMGAAQWAGCIVAFLGIGYLTL